MTKSKYHFNAQSLQIEKVEASLKSKLKKVAWVVASGLVFSFVIVFIAFSLIDSPKEKMLKREIEQYKLQYEIMNDKMANIDVVLHDLENRDDNIYRIIFEADPIAEEVRKAGIGGADRYADLQGYESSKILTETAKKLDEISRRLYIQSKSFDEIFELAKKKEDMLACIPAIQPTSKKESRVVSGFGYRIHPVYKTLRMHTGVDFAAKRGVPVYATGDGKVISPKGNQSGYGIVVVLDHGYGYKSLYAHLSKKKVRIGQKVKRGELIGYVGSSGLSSGPHLHYEIIRNGKKINPVHYFYNDLTPEEYEKMLEIASQVNQSLS